VANHFSSLVNALGSAEHKDTADLKRNDDALRALQKSILFTFDPRAVEGQICRDVSKPVQFGRWSMC